MQTWSYWKQFENTGKIEDYLSYRECDSRRLAGNAGCQSDYQESFRNIPEREDTNGDICRDSYR